jgi:hypothetical protein
MSPRRLTAALIACALVISVLGCGGDDVVPSDVDGGADAGSDASVDGGVDSGAGTDLGIDCATVDVDGDGESACTDCDDDDPGRYHGATEVCDSDDEDCDDTTYGVLDVDADGYTSWACCNSGTCGDDCDDANPAASPVGGEVCNGIDDDCDGLVDEALPTVIYFPDCDRDGAGDSTVAGITGCAAPSTPPGCTGGVWVDNSNDCDDTDPSVHRGATDFCGDSTDSDCDPATAGSPVIWYRDADGDGIGNPGMEVSACAAPAGYVRSTLGVDCDDADPTRFPGNAELCNGLDDDCDVPIVVDEGAAGDCMTRPRVASAMCIGGTCVVSTCAPGSGSCDGLGGNGCEVDLTVSLANCGFCGNACPSGAHSAPGCTAGICSIVCAPGYGDCNGLPNDGCESDLAGPDTCRSCGTSCPGRANASRTCSAAIGCGFTCAGGFRDCNGTVDDGCEVDLASPDTCGGCTTVCPARTNATRTCAASACGYSCVGAYRDCNGSASDGCEVDGATDAAHCGACGNACPSVANGVGVCAASACGVACDVGYVLRVGACVAIAPPRQLAPLSTSTTTSRRPTFQWVLASGTDGAHVEVCTTRACTTVVASFDATGTTGAPPVDLTPGTKFWRVFGRAGANTGVIASYVWQVLIGVRSAPRNTSFGTIPDFNGDGFADIAVASNAVPGLPGTVHVYHGSTLGPPSTPSRTLTGAGGAGGYFGAGVVSAGDVNGDGFGDLLVGAPGIARAYVYYGSPSGLPSLPSAILGEASGVFGRGLAALGDTNGDGYADLLVGGDGGPGYPPYAHVFLGSASGPPASPTVTLVGPASGGYFGYTMSGGDVNGDGLGDAIIGAYADAGGGRVYVYHGAAGLGLSGLPDVTLVAPVSGGTFGWSVAHAGDIDGDGYGDVAVGNPNAGSGRLYIYNGSGVGLPVTPSVTRSAPADGTAAGFGVFVAHGGDVNHDGYADLFTSNRVYPTADSLDLQGCAYAYYGSAFGLSSAPSVTLPNIDGTNAAFGTCGGGADFDGDGNGDFAVGSRVNDRSGRVHVYRGAAGGLAGTQTWVMSGPDGAGSWFAAATAP